MHAHAAPLHQVILVEDVACPDVRARAAAESIARGADATLTVQASTAATRAGADLVVFSRGDGGPPYSSPLGDIGHLHRLPRLVVAQTWPPTRFVAGYDASPAAHAAALVAATIAAALSLPMELVFAAGDAAAESPRGRWSIDQFLESGATRVAHRSGVRPRVSVAPGPPIQALLDASGPDALLAVGVRPATRTRQTTGVATGLLHAAIGPLLVIPEV